MRHERAARRRDDDAQDQSHSNASNTFYAILANRFIEVIDESFGKSIAAFSPAELAAIAAADPFAPK